MRTVIEDKENNMNDDPGLVASIGIIIVIIVVAAFFLFTILTGVKV